MTTNQEIAVAKKVKTDWIVIVSNSNDFKEGEKVVSIPVQKKLSTVEELRYKEQEIEVIQREIKVLKDNLIKEEYFEMFKSVAKKKTIESKIKASYSIVKHFVEKGFPRENVIKKLAKDIGISAKEYGAILNPPKDFFSKEDKKENI